MSAEVKSMKEWALYYAELGLAVFPLAYRNKVPAIEGGCKAATTEKSKIERWWNQNPRYNIGIATGNKSNGLVVIDLDVDKNKGIDGYRWYFELVHTGTFIIPQRGTRAAYSCADCYA